MMPHSIKMEVGSPQPQSWWIETSRNWIIRAYGNVGEGIDVKDFDELLDYSLRMKEMTFLQIAQEWNVSLEVLAELVADHIRRLE